MPRPEGDVSRAQPPWSQQSRLACANTRTFHPTFHVALWEQRLKKNKNKKQVPFVAVHPVLGLDIMTLDRRGIKAFSNLQWLPLLHESELTTLVSKFIRSLFLNILPVIWVEITRGRVGLGGAFGR